MRDERKTNRMTRVVAMALAPIAGLVAAAICCGADDSPSAPAAVPLSMASPTTAPTTTPSTMPAALTPPAVVKVEEAGSAESHAALAVNLAGKTGAAAPPATHPATNPAAVPSTNPALATALVPTTIPTTLPTTMPTTATASATTRPAIASATGGYSSSGRDRNDRYSSKRSGRSSDSAQPKLEAPTASKPMPAQYAILEQRSLFSKVKPNLWKPGGVIDAPPPVPVPGTNPTTLPVDPGPPVPSYHPEPNFAVRGLAEEDHVPVGLVEDGTTGRTFEVHIGDAVARGHIKALSLTGLDYEVGTRVTRVHLGDNFDGEPAVTATTRPSTPAIAGTAPLAVPPVTRPGAPAAVAPAPPPSGGALTPAEERMRARRLAEGGR